jgi:hypothetical protein
MAMPGGALRGPGRGGVDGPSAHSDIWGPCLVGAPLPANSRAPQTLPTPAAAPPPQLPLPPPRAPREALQLALRDHAVDRRPRAHGGGGHEAVDQFAHLDRLHVRQLRAGSEAGEEELQTRGGRSGWAAPLSAAARRRARATTHPPFGAWWRPALCSGSLLARRPHLLVVLRRHAHRELHHAVHVAAGWVRCRGGVVGARRLSAGARCDKARAGRPHASAPRARPRRRHALAHARRRAPCRRAPATHV